MSIMHYLVGGMEMKGWLGKMETKPFVTNTVLIIDNVSCLEQVFSLLSLRTKTAKMLWVEISVKPQCFITSILRNSFLILGYWMAYRTHAFKRILFSIHERDIIKKCIFYMLMIFLLKREDCMMFSFSVDLSNHVTAFGFSPPRLAPSRSCYT